MPLRVKNAPPYRVGKKTAKGFLLRGRSYGGLAKVETGGQKAERIVRKELKRHRAKAEG
jgi:hypothetical protein